MSYTSRPRNGEQPMSNIICPHYNDVLNGRGKFAMNWMGNRFFRALVEIDKAEYIRADDTTRTRIAHQKVNAVRSQNPPGRFLRLDAVSNEWNDIGNKKALRKTRQALVERSRNNNTSSSTTSTDIINV